MELWDAYNEAFQKIPGVSLVRGEPVPEGMRHLVCDVIVRHTDGDWLLMQRDPRKHFGLLWEATAGGSALAGEDPLTCAVRELKEETGIPGGHLTQLGTLVCKDTIYVSYLCVTDREKEKITLREGETVAFRWVSSEYLRTMDQRTLVTWRIQTYLRELRDGSSGGDVS